MLELRCAGKSRVKKKAFSKKVSTPVLQDINLVFPDKGLVFICGPSGSGKTTLLNILAGATSIDEGDFLIDGESTQKFKESQWNTYRSQRVGVVFQDCAMVPFRSVTSNIAVGCELSGFSDDDAKQAATRALDALGISHLADKMPEELSGEELQIIAIARAIAGYPDILLADEPFSRMDSKSAADARSAFEELAQDKLVVITTKDITSVAYADCVIELANGRVVANDIFPGVAAFAAERAAQVGQGVHAAQAGQVGQAAEVGQSAQAAQVAQGVHAAQAGQMPQAAQAAQGAHAAQTAKMATTSLGALEPQADHADHVAQTANAGQADQATLAGTGAYAAQAAQGVYAGQTAKMPQVQQDSIASGGGSEPSKNAYDDFGKTQRRRRRISLVKAFRITLSKMKNKENRTLGAGVAGAVGIMGIALVLALTTGVQNYVDKIESATLNAFPLEFSGTGYDTSYQLATTSLEDSSGQEVSNLTTMVEDSGANDLKSLKAYFESGKSDIDRQAKAIEYSYSVTPQFYAADTSNGARGLSPNSVLSLYSALASLSDQSTASLSLSGEVYHPMPECEELYTETYTVLEGRWPSNCKECVVVLDSEGKITDQILLSLGMLDTTVLNEAVKNLLTGKEGALDAHCAGVTYKDLLGAKIKMVYSADYYQKDETYGGWKNMSGDADYMTSLVNAGEDITVVGVVSPNIGNGLPTLDTGVNYPISLQTYIAEQAGQREIVKEQLENTEVDVLSGLTFDELADTDLMSKLGDYGDSLGAIGSEKIDDVTGIIDLTADSLAKALGMAETLVNDITSIDLSKISVNMPQIIASLQEKGYTFPEYPKPTEEDFEAAGITGVTSDTIKKVAEAMLNLVKNEQSNFPYQMALTDKDTLTERFVTWLSSETTVVIDGVDTGLTPIEYMKSVLENSLGKVVSVGQVTQFLVSYVLSTFPDYVVQNVEVVTQILGDAVSAEITKVLDPAAIESIVNNVGGIKVNLEELTDLETLSNQLIYLTGALLKESGASVEENLKSFGYAEQDTPSRIYVYPKNLDAKDKIKEIIATYNTNVEAAGMPERTITYIDAVGTVSDAIVSIVKVVGLLPMLLISISVIVCAVMVGVCTRLYSQLRRQEFGIMRAMGASRGDILRLILAEAGMQGVAAGIIGVVVVWLLCLVANAVIHNTLGIAGLVELPLLTALILILVNVVLTLIAGFAPALKGSRKPIAESLKVV